MPILTASGPHVFRWPGAHDAMTDAPAIAAQLVAIGAVGIIPQASLSATKWCVAHAKAFADAGIQMTVGLGMDGDHSVDEYVDAIVCAIDSVGRVGLDWEAPGKWETRSGNELAHAIVEGVLHKRPDAAEHVTDFGWWAPFSLPDGHSTHPHAPTKEFGRLCGHERYPQTYGAARAVDGETPQSVFGRSRRYLNWARDLSQYAALGTWEIRPSYQAYARTKQDHVEALLHDRTQCIWDLDEMDDVCKAAMIDVKRLRQLGHDGPIAVVEFQVAAGLKADGVCGPRTSDALAALAPKS